MLYDSPEWNWGAGYCKKHCGQDIPCQVCIDSNDPNLIGIIDGKITPMKTRDEILNVNFQPLSSESEMTQSSIQSTNMIYDSFDDPEAFDKIREKLLLKIQYDEFSTQYNAIGNEFFSQAMISKIQSEPLTPFKFSNVHAKEDKPSFFDELVDAAGRQYQELIDHGGTPEQIAELKFDQAFPELKLYHPPHRQEHLANHPAYAKFGDKTVETRRSLMDERILNKDFAEVDRQAEETILRMYADQPRALDDLPYTTEMERIAIAIIKLIKHELPVRLIERWTWQRLIKLRKSGKLPHKS